MLKRLALVAIGLMAAGVGYAQPDLPVVSNFDGDDEGWSPVDAGEGGFAHVPTGGHPGGYYRFTDADSGSGFVRAPAKFLGDWSGLDGVARLRFDHQVVNLGEGANGVAQFEVVLLPAPPGFATRPEDVLLGGVPQYRFTPPHPLTLTGGDPSPTAWASVSIPISESQWSQEAGTWAALLGDVVELQVRLEMISNAGTNPPGTGVEQDGLDNVRLVMPSPVPALRAPLIGPLVLLIAALGVARLSRGALRGA